MCGAGVSGDKNLGKEEKKNREEERMMKITLSDSTIH